MKVVYLIYKNLFGHIEKRYPLSDRCQSWWLMTEGNRCISQKERLLTLGTNADLVIAGMMSWMKKNAVEKDDVVIDSY